VRAVRIRAFAVGACLALLCAAPPASAVEIQRVESPGGIEAWLVEEHTIPIIAVEIAFGGGGALDPAGKEGLANLLSGLLDEGAGDLDSQAFQKRIEELAVRLGFQSYRDTFWTSLKTLTENRDEAFALLSLALTAPRFDADAVERVRGQVLSGLKRDAEDPDEIAGRVFMETAFPDHPYGRPPRGTTDSVAAIAAADLREAMAQRFATANATIGVVGDIDPVTLGLLLDRTLGALPAEPRTGEIAETSPTPKASLTVIRKPVPQSVIRFGLPGVKRSDPDFYAAYLMNHVLGGGSFTSRLYGEVREKRGLAYSVYSYLSTLNHAGLVAGGVASANARAAEALEVIRGELSRLGAEGITEDELRDAKTYINGAYPLRLDSNSAIAQSLVAIQLEDLGIDYMDRRSGYIDAVTTEDIRRVAHRLIRPDALTVVVVGDPAGIKDPD
jgi:zinc protease